MRILLPLAALAAVALLPCAARAQTSEQPNVLFISVDDLNTAVGFLSEEPGNLLQTLYPDPIVRARVRQVLTPNLDALAASGAPFARAYAPSAICAPSRAALMTGVRTHVSRFTGGEAFRENEVLADVATIPEYLRAHGYYTAGVGKVFHSSGSVMGEDGELDDRADIVRSWETWVNRSTSVNAATTWSPWSPGEDRFRFGVNAKPLAEQTDYVNADVMAQALRFGRGTLADELTGETVSVILPNDRPFFLAVGLFRPHLPWVVPDEIRDLFSPDDLALSDDLRQAYFQDTDDLSPEALLQIYRVGDTVVDGFGKLLYDHGESLDASGGAVRAWKEAVRHYLASIAQSDRIVGHLLDALENGPYADNTVVVLWGDHGWHLGEKTWFGKTTLWEESAQTVLIIRAPGLVDRPGTLRQQPVSLVDVFPTLLTLTGAPFLADLGGDDLMPLLADADAPAVSTALTSMGVDDHTLRTDTHRYVRFNNDLANAELYDVIADPEERVNLIDDPSASGVRLEMETLMDMALSESAVPVSAPPLPTPPEASALGIDAPTPNPSASQAFVTYRLDAGGEVTLALYDALGRRVAILDAGLRSAGAHRVRVPTAPLAPGAYVLRLQASGGTVSQRLLVAR